MKQPLLLRSLAIMTLVVSACTDSPTGHTGSSIAGLSARASASVAGSTGFGFLPPTVKSSAPIAGTFDPTRTPTVRVVCTVPSGPSCPTVASFVMGPGADGIRVDMDDESYAVLWQVPSTLKLGAGTYRLDVFDGAQRIGSGDLWVARTTQDAHRVTGPYVAVVSGKPILIKFRITTVAGGALEGAFGAPAVDVVPNRQSAVRFEDFAKGHPTLIDIDVSFNTLMLRLAPTATVGETNAMLAAVDATVVGGARGVAARAPALLVLRFPTTTHAELAERMALLRSYGIVLGVSPDVLQRADALPRGGALPIPADWTWELPSNRSGGGNWGLERARVPQMWHLNGIVSREGVSTRTGVWEIDDGPFHKDVETNESITPGLRGYDDHGIAVTAILGATHNNGGMDGVSPFARIVTGQNNVGEEADVMPLSLAATAISAWINADVRVVNASWGLDYLKGKPAATAPEITAVADEHGRVIYDVLYTLELLGSRLPIFVVSGGNYSVNGVQNPVQFSGAMKNAAMVHGVAAIITVEALAELSGGGIARSSFSSVGGTLSAPGESVLSATYSDGYALTSGTSFAAPFVSGIASYLYSLYPALPAPTMSSNAVRDLLLANSVAVATGTAPRVDAFATALDADRVMGGTRALRGLLDIDDGTFDGNTRVDLNTGAEDVGAVMGGNGRVDMRDFRRWRDWLLQAENPAGLSLNGRADHPKRDLNGDGAVQTAAQENVFARGDFNGDGVISLNDRAVMPQSLNRANLTDLEVLQRLFEDPLYPSSDLPSLVSSGDVELNATACLGVPGTATVRVFVRRKTLGTLYKQVLLRPEIPRTLLTLPADADNFVVRFEARGSDGLTVLATSEQEVDVNPGSDVLANSPCYRLDVSLTLPERLAGGRASGLSLLATLVDPATGATTPASAADVTLFTTNGTTNPVFGTTSTAGTFSASITPTATATSISVEAQVQTSTGFLTRVSATRPVDPEIIVTPPPPTPSVTFNLMTGTSSGKPVNPFTLRARFTNYPGVSIRWTASSAGNGTGYVAFGPTATQPSIQVRDPVIVSEYVTDLAATITLGFNPIYTVNMGITVNVSACMERDGAPILLSTGAPWCIRREYLY